MMTHDIAGKVRRARRDMKLSQSGLAAQAGVSRPTVARIEAGRETNLASLIAVLGALGLRLEVVR